MHLLDKVAQAKEPIVVGNLDGTNAQFFPGTDALATDVAQCPLRYVLHDDVTKLCTELAFEDDTLLGSSIELLRVPAPKLWIEFVESARHNVFSNLGLLNDKAASSSHQRVGLFITSDERGRNGYVEVCWENGDGLSPDVAPFVIEYNFDDEFFSKSGFVANDDACIGIDVGNIQSLNPLFRHIRFRLRTQWHRYYKEKAGSDIRYRELMLLLINPLLEDVPFFAMFCLLLMSKNALRQQAGDRSRLNRSRERRGRSPLLDHIELTMNLAPFESVPGDATNAELRASPRIHFVRGHLVRRGNAIFWRTSHMRGKPEIGSIRSRTISLHIATG